MSFVIRKTQSTLSFIETFVPPLCSLWLKSHYVSHLRRAGDNGIHFYINIYHREGFLYYTISIFNLKPLSINPQLSTITPVPPKLQTSKL
ncbi:hypothetical protein SAMN03080601_02029 [Alkalitalea saponilacus]|uniref:Uncharacterized protein n=1 Tax=Alkalitalea saponilacus TaxID=889453 RepID=A0A1T5H1E2_9BACT|nr:hypothetical protein SAMN03080601_02029 [Alkalitalea saponilacus]